MSAQVLHLPLEVPGGLSNIVEMAFQEMEAAGRDYRDQRRRVRRGDLWDDEREMDLLRFHRERRDRAQRRYWRLRRERAEDGR